VAGLNETDDIKLKRKRIVRESPSISSGRRSKTNVKLKKTM
jgi:hypothetical protein